MKARIIIFYLLFANFSYLTYSQITIGNIEKQNVKTALRPEPYDSLKNFGLLYNENEIEFKKYIGLQFYLPPFKNPNASEFKTNRPFLFATSPNIISINSPIIYDYVARKNDYTPIHIKIWYNKIYTYVYKPFHYGTDKKHYRKEIDPKGYYYGTYDKNIDDYHDFHISNDESVSNTYFTLIDVLLKESWERIDKKMRDILDNKEDEIYKVRKHSSAESDYWNNSSDRIIVSHDLFKRDRLEKQIFVLRNDKNGDTIYCDGYGINKFILVPYFVKLKQIYDGKIFLFYNEFGKEGRKYDVSIGEKKIIPVPVLSKWTCSVDLLNIWKDGTKLRDNKYKIWCIFKNDKGQTILEKPDKITGFIEEHIYNKQEAEKKMNQQQLIAKHKQEDKIRREKERKEKELFKLKCIKKYGTINGELIAQGKVKIGMTKEMCRVAWGSPFWSDKTTTKYGVSESWYYGFGNSLHFDNESLIIIDE